MAEITVVMLAGIMIQFTLLNLILNHTMNRIVEAMEKKESSNG